MREFKTGLMLRLKARVLIAQISRNSLSVLASLNPRVALNLVSKNYYGKYSDIQKELVGDLNEEIRRMAEAFSLKIVRSFMTADTFFRCGYGTIEVGADGVDQKLLEKRMKRYARVFTVLWFPLLSMKIDQQCEEGNNTLNIEWIAHI